MPTDDGAFVETRLAAKKNADEMGKWLPVLGDDTILIIGIAVVRYYYVVRIMDWRPRRWTPNLQTCSTGISMQQCKWRIAPSRDHLPRSTCVVCDCIYNPDLHVGSSYMYMYLECPPSVGFCDNWL